MITFVAMAIIAGMIRHIFKAAPVESLAMVILNGFGLRLFIASSWIVMNKPSRCARGLRCPLMWVMSTSTA